MLRVTSRQRLVSWDAFDATQDEVDVIPTIDDDDEYYKPLATGDEESVSGYLTCVESFSRNTSFVVPDSSECRNSSCNVVEKLLEDNSAERYFMGQLAEVEENQKQHRKKRDRGHDFSFSSETKVSGASSMKRNVSFGSTTMFPDLPAFVVTEDSPRNRLMSSPRKWLSAKARALQESRNSILRNSSIDCMVQLGVRNKIVLSASLNEVGEDVKLSIMSFLGAQQIRTFSATCKSHWKLSRTELAWDTVLRQKFLLLNELDGKITYQDNSGIPLARQLPNFSATHALAQPYPTHIDDLFVKSVPYRNKPVRFRSFMFNKQGSLHPVPVVQFTGRVGTGDRCVQSNAAFPHIDLVSTSNSKKWCPHSLLDLFCRGGSSTLHSMGEGALTYSTIHENEEPNPAQIMSRTWSLCGVTTLRPFVSPYVTSVKSSSLGLEREVNLSPRLFSYFEITILERDEGQEPPAKTSLDQSSRRRQREDFMDLPHHGTSTDCIAIGLSTSKFDVHHKMPGWCRYSYGFHGDDGGLFHGNGDMLRKFGPTFGVGDTVGCGIDYANHGIFFTLNGKFLGYGWRGVKLTCPLYPTVGIDSNSPIEVNFGHAPYQFDLSPFSKQHKALIETAFSGFPVGCQTI